MITCRGSWMHNEKVIDVKQPFLKFETTLSYVRTTGTPCIGAKIKNSEICSFPKWKKRTHNDFPCFMTKNLKSFGW